MKNLNTFPTNSLWLILPPAMDAALSMLDARSVDFNIDTIVLDVDSPGGNYYGTPETSSKIRAARDSKPIIAVANSLAASAAYWIASAADEIVVTPSGDVGSIGVLAVHTDFSAANEKIGV